MAIKIAVEGTELVVRIPLDTKGTLSKSGKSHVLGSTEGFTSVSTLFGTVKIGLNVITTDGADWQGGLREGKLPVQPAPTLVKTGGAAAH